MAALIFKETTSTIAYRFTKWYIYVNLGAEGRKKRERERNEGAWECAALE